MPAMGRDGLHANGCHGLRVRTLTMPSCGNDKPAESHKNAREQAAHAQSQLVTALMADGPLPPGFDPDDCESTARSLLAKRYRLVQLAWPGLIDALGTHATELFAEFAKQSPLPIESQGRRDGYYFARWLPSMHRLPDECRIILMLAELQGIDRKRHGLALRFAWLRERKRPLVGIKVPGCAPWIVPSWLRLK